MLLDSIDVDIAIAVTRIIRTAESALPGSAPSPGRLADDSNDSDDSDERPDRADDMMIQSRDELSSSLASEVKCRPGMGISPSFSYKLEFIPTQPTSRPRDKAANLWS